MKLKKSIIIILAVVLMTLMQTAQAATWEHLDKQLAKQFNGNDMSPGDKSGRAFFPDT